MTRRAQDVARIRLGAALTYAGVRHLAWGRTDVHAQVPDGTSIERIGDQWFIGTGEGRVRVAFAERNPYGVLDHRVTLPSGEVISIPMRVIPDGNACEVVFTLRRQPEMSDGDFERDTGLVHADLARLKRVLEAPG